MEKQATGAMHKRIKWNIPAKTNTGFCNESSPGGQGEQAAQSRDATQTPMLWVTCCNAPGHELRYEACFDRASIPSVCFCGHAFSPGGTKVVPEEWWKDTTQHQMQKMKQRGKLQNYCYSSLRRKPSVPLPPQRSSPDVMKSMGEHNGMLNRAIFHSQ